MKVRYVWFTRYKFLQQVEMIPDHVLSSLVIYLQPSSRRQPCFLEKNNSTSLRKTPASSNSSLLPSALSPNSYNNDELQQDPLVTRCLTLSTMILAITVYSFGYLDYHHLPTRNSHPKNFFAAVNHVDIMNLCFQFVHSNLPPTRIAIIVFHPEGKKSTNPGNRIIIKLL